MSRKFAVQIVCLIMSLTIVGFLMQQRFGYMLNATLEQTIANQTSDMAIVAEERFQQELAQLLIASEYLANHPKQEDWKDILSILAKENSGVTVGIVYPSGAAILGESLSQFEFVRLPMAAQGNSIVDYCAGKGLLFAVPVIKGGLIHAIVYRLYPENMLTDLFGLTEYNSDSKLLIQERDGIIIVPYKNYDDNLSVFINFTNSSLESNGFYGILNETYYDGTLWEPEEGWDPHTRPWYLGAKADPKNIVFTDVYVDDMTGTSVVSISKEVFDKDGKSLGVVAGT